jgi:hypothetical protein
MRQISEGFRRSPWPGVLWLIAAAAAVALLVVCTGRVERAFNNQASQQLSATTRDLGPAGSRQTQWW